VTKDPDLVRKMTRALVKANKWALQSTPEQVAEALKPFLGQTDPALLLAGAKAVQPALSADGRTTERSVQSTQDLLEQSGLLKKRVPYSEIVTNEFLPK
jgi:ABC-type nitrate/sulfonate/bicarbonate transport system substrate-binding protein